MQKKTTSRNIKKNESPNNKKCSSVAVTNVKKEETKFIIKTVKKKEETKEILEKTIPVQKKSTFPIINQNNDKTMENLLFFTRQKSRIPANVENTHSSKQFLELLSGNVKEEDIKIANTKIATFARNYIKSKSITFQQNKNFDKFEIFDANTQKFEINDVLLGCGANASVYKIFDNTKNLSFALKVIELYLDEGGSEQKYAAIMNEIEIMERLKTLNSDFFIQIEKVFRKKPISEKKEEIFLIMELCECSLQDILSVRSENSQNYSEGELLFYFWDLFSAMKILHSANISHRDVKPRNLLYKNGKLKYADFGESKYHFQNSENDQFINTVRGTPLYMSKEVFSHFTLRHFEGKFDTFSSDYYSLGITFLVIKNLDKVITRSNIEELIEKTKLENDISSQIIIKLLDADENQRKKGSDQFFEDKRKIIQTMACKPDEKAVISIIRLQREKTPSSPEHFKKLFLIASTYYKMKNLSKARELYIEILETLGTKDLKEHFVDLLIYKTNFELGRVENDILSNKTRMESSSESFSGIQRLEEALNILTKKLTNVFPEETYKYEYGDLLNELGISNKNLGNIEKALKYYNKSLEFAKEIYGQDSYNSAVTMHNLGEIYYETGKYEMSQLFFEKSLSIYESQLEQIKDQDILIKINNEIKRSLYDLGLSYMVSSNLEKARVCFLNCSLKIKNSIERDFQFLGEALNSLGEVLMKMNLDTESQNTLQEAIDLAEEQNCLELKGLSYFNMASLNAKCINFEQAEKNFLKAVKIYEELPEHNGATLGNLLYNLGAVALNMKNVENAKDYFLKALKYYENSNAGETNQNELKIKEFLKNI